MEKTEYKYDFHDKGGKEMITREKAKKIADETISSILLQSIFGPGSRSFSEVEALCYAFSELIMQRAFQKDDLADDHNGCVAAVAAQCTTLACAIDAGVLPKQYIYNSYVNLVQGWSEETDDK